MPKDFTKLALLLAGHVDDLQRLALTWSRDTAFRFSEKDRELTILAEMMAQDFGQPTMDADNSRKLAKIKSMIESMREEGRISAMETLNDYLDSLVRNEDKFNRAWLLAIFAFMGKPKPKLNAMNEEQYYSLRRHGLFGKAAMDDIFNKIAVADADRLYSIIHRRVYGQLDTKQMRVAVDKALQTTQYQVVINVTMIVNGVSNDTAVAVARRNETVADGLMWITEMDERVCSDCDSLEGEVFAIDSSPGCPLHPNCRCHLVPVTNDFQSEIRKIVKAGKES